MASVQTILKAWSDRLTDLLQRELTKHAEFDESGRKVLQTGRKHGGKRSSFSFPTVFSKDLYNERFKI